MASSSSTSYVREEDLFTPAKKQQQRIVGIDIDTESPLIIDRCLNHVRTRIGATTSTSSSSSSSEGGASSSASEGHTADDATQSQTLAAHLDDVAACREKVWQHIYHPRNKQHMPIAVSMHHSTGTMTASSLSPAVSSSEGGLGRSANDPSQQRVGAFDALRRMEEAQQRAQREEAEALRADVAARSIGTSTEEVASGDAVNSAVTRRVMQTVTHDNTTSDSNAEEGESTALPTPAATAAPPRQPSAKQLMTQQRLKDNLLALFDAAKPDPLIGALPLPTCHFANDPFGNKRSKNILLLKYLGTTYPGGRSELRRELPFAFNTKTGRIEHKTRATPSSANVSSSPLEDAAAASISPSAANSNASAGINNKKGSAAAARAAAQQKGPDNAALEAMTTKELGPRALVLYEDRRRRAILSAIATQLGGGAASPATAANFIKVGGGDNTTSDNHNGDVALRIGAGAGTSSSSSSSSSSVGLPSNMQKVLTLQTLYNIQGGFNVKVLNDALIAAAYGRPIAAATVEYALDCFKKSPFDVKHYPIKLFGFIQPTAIGLHSNFPLTRFNIFELDHTPEMRDKLRANVRRIRHLRANEEKAAAAGSAQSSDGASSSSSSTATSTTFTDLSISGADSEQLLLKKWSVFGTIFPARSAYHVKGVWSSNAKLTLPEAHKALGLNTTNPTAAAAPAGGASTSNGDNAAAASPLPPPPSAGVHEVEDTADEDLFLDSEDKATARLVKTQYRLGNGRRERGLMSVGIDADRVRAVELVNNAKPIDSATAVGSASSDSAADADATDGAAMVEKVEAQLAANNTNVKQKQKAPVTESVVRPLTAADRSVVGMFQDSEVSVSWRRFWNPRWAVEAYARHVEGIPSIQDHRRRSNEGSSSAAAAGEDIAEVPVADLAGPTNTSVGIRIRADHSGRLFTQTPSAFISSFFAPLYGSDFARKSSDSSSSYSRLSGWAASTYATNAYLDPIQRHLSLKAQLDLVKLSVLPRWGDCQGKKADAIDGSSSSSAAWLHGYDRLRDLLSFDLRVRVLSEAKSGGDIASFTTVGDSYQYSGPSSSADGTAAVERLRRYVRSVRLPTQAVSNTVRSVKGHEEAVYGTERLAGNWFVTSSVELSKPISFINVGSSISSTTDANVPPPPPPLRFLVFWNGLWSANSANNKETIGYAVRREPHASRRELKGWYNTYLPTSLECSWSSLWSAEQQRFTNTPSPSDLPAGSTFFKFMKCGAVWDI